MPLSIEIVTPEQRVLTTECDEVRLPGVDGGFGIRPGHTPLVAALAPGELVYVIGGTEHRYAVGEGFSEVSNDRVRVLVEEAVRADQIDPAVAFRIHQPDACIDRRQGLVRCHRRLARAVSRPGRDAHLPQRWMAGKRPGHAEIGHDDPGARMAGQDVDRRATAEQVLYHLRGDHLRIRAHALGHHSVVAGQREDDGTVDPRRTLSRDLRQSPGQLLEAAQAAARFRLEVQFRLRQKRRLPTDRCDRGTSTLQYVHETSPPLTGTTGAGFRRSRTPNTPKYTSSAISAKR